jgi:hypothetical protein
MKAIVLTYDKYRCLTNHMIHQYRRRWPDNPFTFRIPYQKLSGRNEADREYIRCPPDIKTTMLALLDGLDDQEWIFWCIDDKYPTSLDMCAIESIVGWIRDCNDPSADGVLFCRPRKLTRQKRLTGRQIGTSAGTTLLERKNYKCIWIHQFLRVKVLRHLFESFPDDIPDAKSMDRLKEHIEKPDDHRLFVTEDTLVVFGESTSRGMLTKNCYRSLQKQGLPLPDWHNGELAETNTHGKRPGRVARLLRNVVPTPVYRTS